MMLCSQEIVRLAEELKISATLDRNYVEFVLDQMLQYWGLQVES